MFEQELMGSGGRLENTPSLIKKLKKLSEEAEEKKEEKHEWVIVIIKAISLQVFLQPVWFLWKILDIILIIQ